MQGLVAVAAGVTLLAVAGGTSSAATAARPVNLTPPALSGSAIEGSVLTGNRGTWSGNPNDFNTWWLRCDRRGNGCKNIAGSGGNDRYRLVARDVGSRIRFSVGAANADGRTWAQSAATDVVVAAKPVNLTPPTISGSPVVGVRLVGSKGTWSGNPTDFNSWWQRCDAQGGSCANISGTAGSGHYRLTAADLGTTIRFTVGAANREGRTWAASAPTARITAAAPPVKNGCPATGTDLASAIAPPARLLVDGIQAPSIVTRQTQELVVRFHVSSTCGGSVVGALVYVTAVPFFQFRVPPEQLSGADGWAELHLQRLAGFPVSSRQQLVALFVRARKAGEPVLAGISTRRLFSVRVNLHA